MTIATNEKTEETGRTPSMLASLLVVDLMKKAGDVDITGFYSEQVTPG